MEGLNRRPRSAAYDNLGFPVQRPEWGERHRVATSSAGGTGVRIVVSTLQQTRSSRAGLTALAAWILVWGLAVGFLASSCKRPEPAVPIGVRDSAGIRIVQHASLPRSSADPHLSVQPEFQVGWAPTDPQFEYVIGGVLLAGGRAAIADLWAHRIFVFSPDGRLEREFGGRGNGPGEIGFIWSILRLGPDTILVQDIGNVRFTLYHADSLVRSVSLLDIGNAKAFGLTGHEVLLKTGTHSSDFRPRWLQSVLSKFDLLSGRVDTLGRFDWVQNERGRRRFDPQGRVAVTSGGLLIGRGDRPEVRVLDFSGHVRQWVRWTAEPPALTEEDWSIYEDYFMTDPVMTLTPSERREIFAAMRPQLGSPLPYFGGLLGDDHGNIWVADHSVNWRVTAALKAFSPQGKWLGTLALPPRFQVLDIFENRILGIGFNDVGVASAIVYRILW